MAVAFIKTVARKVLPWQFADTLAYWKNSKLRLPSHHVYIDHVKGKKGLEVGGPSSIFRTTLPLYRTVGALDGVNFSADTVWEGRIRTGLNFNYIGNRKGLQYISEATDLSQIPDG